MGNKSNIDKRVPESIQSKTTALAAKNVPKKTGWNNVQKIFDEIWLFLISLNLSVIYLKDTQIEFIRIAMAAKLTITLLYQSFVTGWPELRVIALGDATLQIAVWLSFLI